MAQSKSKRFVPSTFEERGTAMPFTTPLLAQARVRKDARNRIELLLARFGTSGVLFVVPWPAVPELSTMTLHDSLLHEAVTRENLIDPDRVRRASLDVLKTGVAGPEAAESAKKAIAAERDYAVTLNVILIVSLIKALDPASAAALLGHLKSDSTDANRRGREILVAAAKKAGFTPEVLDSHLTQLSDVATPVGVAFANEPGRLRKVLQKLIGLRDSWQEWERTHVADAREMAGAFATVADHTVAIAEGVLREWDGLFGNLRGLVTHWDERFPKITALGIRLSWLLDGWDFVAELWSAVADKTVNEQIDSFELIRPILPMVPLDEREEEEQEATDDLFLDKKGKFVQVLEDWRTGNRIDDLVCRIEGARAKAVAT